MATYKQEMAKALRRWRAKGFAEQAECAAQGISNSTEGTWYSDFTWAESRNNNGDRGTIDAGMMKVATWGLWYCTDADTVASERYSKWAELVALRVHSPRGENSNRPFARDTAVLCACVAYDNTAYANCGRLWAQMEAAGNVEYFGGFSREYTSFRFAIVKPWEYADDGLPYVAVGYWRKVEPNPFNMGFENSMTHGLYPDYVTQMDYLK